MNFKVFGIGAAGNKAAIGLIENGVMEEKDVVLLNTTIKDIPEKYKTEKAKMIFQFSSEFGGCGKVPSVGTKAIKKAIKEGKLDLSTMIDQDTNQVILVTSTEGGTGCGATPILAKVLNAMNIPVHVFAFIGFQDDPKGMENTLSFFKRFGDCNIIMHTVCNSEFIDASTNQRSYVKAEMAANEYFADQVLILKGSKMIPSMQNIDDTDLYKITTTPGYMYTEHLKLNDLKNTSAFNGLITETMDNLKCLNLEGGCKRIGVVINATDKVQSIIDSKMSTLKRYTGEPYEMFTHIQYDNSTGNWMDIMVSGMDLPESELASLGDKYKSSKGDTFAAKKSFSDIFEDIEFDIEDGEDELEIKEVKEISKDTLFEILDDDDDFPSKLKVKKAIADIDDY